jgi:hypothetical protein
MMEATLPPASQAPAPEPFRGVGIVTGVGSGIERGRIPIPREGGSIGMSNAGGGCDPGADRGTGAEISGQE